MKKQVYTFLGIIIFQLCILLFIVGNYEYMKNSGTTVYIKAVGYDPVDLFRGNYVQIAYEVPLTKTQAEQVSTQGYDKKMYITPKILDKKILGIENISSIKPNKGLYFTSENAWVQEGKNYTVIGEDKQRYIYRETWCDNNKIEINADVIFEKNADSNQISYIITDIEGIEQVPFYGQRLKGKVVEISNCTQYLRVMNPSVSRYFVQEGTAQNLEKKIQDSQIYAEWKIQKNGKIILTNLIDENSLK